MNKINTLYMQFEYFDKEDILTALSILTEEEINVLKLKFGEDYLTPISILKLDKDTQNNLFRVLRKIEKQLYNIKNLKRGRKLLNIYTRFNDFSKEEVLNALSMLKEEEINILKLKFGEDYLAPISNRLLTKEQCNLLQNTIKKLENILNGKINLKRGPKLKTIYTYFNNYPKEEIDKLLLELNEEDKLLIKLKYGSDLENPITSEDMTAKQKKEFLYLLTRLGKKLSGVEVNVRGKHTENIYGFFKDYSKEEVDNVIESLSDKDREIINLRYGNNLENPVIYKEWDKKESKYFYCNIIPKMRNRLLNPSNRPGRKPRKIYDILDEYTKEEIDNAIQLLSIKEQYIFKLRFGNNYDESLIVSKEINNNVNILIRKINKILKPKNRINKKLKSIYEHFPKYSKEEIDEVISSLNEYDRNIIKLKYGYPLENIKNPLIWNKKYSNYFHANIIRKIRVRLGNPNFISRNELKLNIEEINIDYIENNQHNFLYNDEITKDDYIKILNFVKSNTFNIMSKTLSVKEAIIFSLKMGYVDNKYFTSSQIAKFLNLDEKEVLKILRKLLTRYEEVYSENYELIKIKDKKIK